MSTVQNTDIYLIGRGEESFRVTANDLLEYFDDPPTSPWIGHDGGIFDINNSLSSFPVYLGGSFTAWDLDGKNERTITEVPAGVRLIFVTDPDQTHILGPTDPARLNHNANFNFGFNTDITNLRSMNHFMYENYSDPDTLGIWDSSNVTDMAHAWHNAIKWRHNLRLDTSKVTNMASMFEGARIYLGEATASYSTGLVTNMSRMFKGCEAWNFRFQVGADKWNTSNVTNMEGMFQDTLQFNQDLSWFDTSNVTNMDNMFKDAKSFNQRLSSWCVPHIPAMPPGFEDGADAYIMVEPPGHSYAGEEIYPQNRPCWGSCPGSGNPCPADVNPLPWEKYRGNMGIFHIKNLVGGSIYLPTGGAFRMYGPAPGGWQNGIVRISRGDEIGQGQERVVITPPNQFWLFKGGSRSSGFNNRNSFDFGEYTDTSGCTSLSGLLKLNWENNPEFGGNWDTSNVTDTSEMFYECFQLSNSVPITSTSLVTNMAGMFNRCENYNRADPVRFDTSNVKNMYRIFYKCRTFNQDISNWDTSQVTDMNAIFHENYNFNQPIGKWNVGNVIQMYGMFWDAYNFNGDISNWCVQKIPAEPEHMFRNCGINESYKPVWGTCP